MAADAPVQIQPEAKDTRTAYEDTTANRNRRAARWRAGLTAGLLLVCAVLLPGCSGGGVSRRGDTSSTLYIGEVGAAFPTSYMPWLSGTAWPPPSRAWCIPPLSQYDENTGEYHPLLADSWCYIDKEGNPIVTPDGGVDYDRLEEVYGGTTPPFFPVRFELNPNATWSDGEPVTAEDIYFTFDIAADQTRSNHAGALAWVSDLLHKYDSQTGRMTRQGIYTYDHGANEAGYPISEEERDHVFYFEVNKVLGAITPLVSTVLVLPEHIYAPILAGGSTLNSTSPNEALAHAYRNPVGCGPYTLDAELTNPQEIVLRRREDYYLRGADGGDLYAVDTLRFILYQDINVAIYALKKGHLDVGQLDQPQLRRAVRSRRRTSRCSPPGLFVQALVLNVNPPADQKTAMREILTDIRREAIALAVDQEELIRNVLNGAGATVPAGLILKSMPDLYNPEADILAGDMEEKRTRANAILDELYPQKDASGYRLTPEGTRISFQILGSPGEQETIGFLQVLFQKIGIEVKFAAKGSSPETTYLYGGNFDMTIQGLPSPSRISISCTIPISATSTAPPTTGGCRCPPSTSRST